MKTKLDDEFDTLFQLPLSEFIAARKTLATRLQKEGRRDEADRVKALAKPPVSAWTVNQLFWRHRNEFNQLIAAGQRFRHAHTSRAAKAGESINALDARREALNRLSDLAEAVLRDAGHSPTLDMLRRIATTLEAMSAYAALPEEQTAGHLTKDLDPPGFESLAPFITAVAPLRRSEPTARVTAPKKAPAPAKKTQPKASVAKEERRQEDPRQAKLAAAKATVQEVKKVLVEARVNAQSLEAAQKKADTEAKHAEKQKREAELRFKEASTASAAASVRAENTARELERARRALADAERAVQKASKELESLFRGR
jgi:hypothetical protein